MIAIEPYEPWHMAAIAVQAAQAGEVAAMTLPPSLNAELGPAFAAVQRSDAGQRVLCCAGFVVNNPAYATAWAMFADGKGAGMVAVTRAVQRVVDAAAWARVDMMVRAGFDRARDYARLLGFEREALLRRVGPDGGDYEVWVRFTGEGPSTALRTGGE